MITRLPTADGSAARSELTVHARNRHAFGKHARTTTSDSSGSTANSCTERLAACSPLFGLLRNMHFPFRPRRDHRHPAYCTGLQHQVLEWRIRLPCGTPVRSVALERVHRIRATGIHPIPIKSRSRKNQFRITLKKRVMIERPHMTAIRHPESTQLAAKVRNVHIQ